MRALLLAAGLGTRLRPITNATPKCLVPINGRPLLDYWISLLYEAGIDEILINLHYYPDAVIEYIANCKYPVKINTVFEQELLGTGGTLLHNRDFFGGDPTILIHADNLSCFSMRDFIERFLSRKDGVEITMMTFNTDAPRNSGIVELDEHGIVNKFHEKVVNPPGNLANGAVYIVSPNVIDFMASLGKKVIDFSIDVLPNYMGKINTFHNDIYHRDIGTLESLRIAQNDYKYLENNGVASE